MSCGACEHDPCRYDTLDCDVCWMGLDGGPCNCSREAKLIACKNCGNSRIIEKCCDTVRAGDPCYNRKCTECVMVDCDKCEADIVIYEDCDGGLWVREWTPGSKSIWSKV